jgi:3-methyladenine DNA glycosylase/8-oxoguanine DNA glycosylase
MDGATLCRSTMIPTDKFCDAFSHSPTTRLSSALYPERQGQAHEGMVQRAHSVSRPLPGFPLTEERATALTAQMRTCLRLDEDFRSFHAAARRYPQFRWITTARAGRMLRAPTVFEDTVKMICTTNCTWALTKLMVSNLVQRAGRAFDDSHSSFPTPAAVAALSERELRTHVKAGYRAPYIRELSQRIASGDLAIEEWRTSTAPTKELFEEIRSVKGVGPYAAGNILKLLGHYDRLGLDSWVRGQYYRLHRKGRKVKDATIEKAYEEYGAWRGLFFWLDMTRYWHDQKFARQSPRHVPTARAAKSN